MTPERQAEARKYLKEWGPVIFLEEALDEIERLQSRDTLCPVCGHKLECPDACFYDHEQLAKAKGFDS